MDASNVSLSRKIKQAVLGKSLSPHDHSIFHKLSLVAFFAWVGLGADGLSSSCYGPAEAFLALGEHPALGVFVALASALTIFVISTSYSQIIEAFPTGGGGYLVASKLLSPKVGMVSGCALLIDYVLTVTLSVASGADALFSFLPPEWLPAKLTVAVAGVVALTVLNMRGVKESVTALVPIFLVFVLTHALVIVYGLGTHLGNFPELVANTARDVRSAHSELGLVGMAFLLLKAYSMGAGTYTGIEAVSNGLPILREPKVKTGRRTMLYMAVSLSVTVVGLMLAYILFHVAETPGKTLNAVLFEAVTRDWGAFGQGFVWVTLVSEAAILFVAAQAGFLDGPRVLANMAMDRWFPTKFAMLSDRFVSQNGVLLMGGGGLLLMILSHGSVDLLIVLYSINVFITFVLSQLGMVRHWWKDRATTAHWRKGLLINGVGLAMTGFILIAVTGLKFFEGGWVTLLVTGALVALALSIRRHYDDAFRLIQRLDCLVAATNVQTSMPANQSGPESGPEYDPTARTAVLLVNGFNGLGLHTLFSLNRTFPGEFKSFVFVQVGMVDAGVFKGAAEVENLKKDIDEQLSHYLWFMNQQGYHAEGVSAIGTDVVHEVMGLAPDILKRFPRAVFFGGQLVFPEETFLTRILHNHVVFAVQRQLYRLGVPFVIMPIRVDESCPA
jgi:amino acid transporter